MTRFAAFIRAIGPETHRVMPQHELCARCSEAGLVNSRSYIASGNLCFSSDKTADACSRIVEEAIAGFGLMRPVFTRSAAELDNIIAGNPFADAPVKGPNALSVSLFDSDLAEENVRALLDHGGPERVCVHKRVVYVHFINGQNNTKISGPVIERRLKAVGTARNMSTILHMRGMLD